MFKRNHHNFYFLLIRRQNGAVLLILLAMILIAVTAVIVSQLSLNAQSINRAKNTTLALSYSKNILLGYALIQPVPGTLPCPDIDGDGEPDPDPIPVPQPCVNYRGLLPYKTLGIARQVDGAGQPLWYVVDRNYVGAMGTGLHNSSHAASLRIDPLVPQSPQIAFIVIAPNSPFPGQSPDLALLDVTQFLEDENANNSLDDTYTSIKNETQNDVLLGVTTVDFWSPIEKMVLDEVEELVRDYVAACDQFPWAADFNDPDAESVDNSFQGGFPFGEALPFDWGTTCSGKPIPALPAWEENWRHLYYAMCNDATPTSPPTNCLTVMTDSPPNQTAAVILIAPGIPRTGQNRTIFTTNNFFEGNNISADNTFDSLTSGANNNDSLRIISP